LSSDCSFVFIHDDLLPFAFHQFLFVELISSPSASRAFPA
jgi:hypothetical protein